MHYLYSVTSNDWWKDFNNHTTGYALFTDYATGQVVLVTHADDQGNLTYVERDNRHDLLETADVVLCCYPAQVRKMYPHLQILGDWNEPTWITPLFSNKGTGVYFVEYMSETEDNKYYPDYVKAQQAL